MPTTRPYIEHHLEQAYERETILSRFGEIYAELADFIYDQLDKSAAAVTIAKYAREDLEQGIVYVKGMAQGNYLLLWGWILYRLGSTQRGLTLLERALEIVQGEDQYLELQVLNNMAMVYQATGKPQEALTLFEQALLIAQEVGNRAVEAGILTNIALLLYQSPNHSENAPPYMEQAINVLEITGLPQDAVGRTVEDLRLLLQSMRAETSPGSQI